MCDHNTSSLKINNIQISDGNTRYTCVKCNNIIISNDVEFNRKYKRLHGCKTHSFEYNELSSIKDINGNIACLWCGILFDEK